MGDAKRLFRVEVVVGFYVVAEGVDSPVDDAEFFAKKALRDQGADVRVNCWAATDPKKIPAEWIGALPYGGDGRTTIREILRAPAPGDHGGDGARDPSTGGGT